MKSALKWIGYILLSLIVTAIVVVAILLNSTKVIEWAANQYAPQYGFGYEKISGGLLTGLDVDGVTFKSDQLLDKLKIRWNPTTLLYKEVSVARLSATKLDVDTIKKVVEAFASDDPSVDQNSTFVLPVSIELDNLHLSAKPFVYGGVKFNGLGLDGRRLFSKK